MPVSLSHFSNLLAMESLTKSKQKAIKKMNSGQIKQKLIGIGFGPDMVDDMSREELIEHWALAVANGSDHKVDSPSPNIPILHSLEQ